MHYCHCTGVQVISEDTAVGRFYDKFCSLLSLHYLLSCIALT